MPAASDTSLMAGGDPHVRFVDVQKSFDGRTLVVKNLNLDVAKGEFLTLLGPSGSGKTTTLLMLAGFEAATHGEIFLSGQPINRVPPHKRGIGMVFQNYALFPHMTVNENLAFPLQVRKLGRAEIEARVTKVLDMVELPQMGNRRPSQLSGGQQQRVAVARALVFNPEIVLMDEPLGALDKQLREQMQYEIKRIHNSVGVTFVYVTHDQGEALTMSDRIAVFRDGVIEQLSSPADLYERPQTAFVARFIGENNRIPGMVRSLNGSTCGVEIAGGNIVEAIKVNVGQLGMPTTLSVRPERVELEPSAPDVANRLQGQVAETIYLGDHVRVRVKVPGSNDFVVKAPNKDGVVQLQAGQNVTVGWRTKDCRALDAS
jgi:putative spermidine/putrescine transport system ATP-binding protein